MSMIVARLPWDSAFFELEVGATHIAGRAAFDGGRAKSTFAGYDLVYVFSPEKLSGLDLEPVDTKLVLVRSTHPCEEIQHEAFRIERFDAAQHPRDALDDLAVASGLHSRFNRDTRIPRDRFRGLFLEWIAKSISGELAFDVLVASAREQTQRPVGLVTIGRETDETAQIGLVSVAGDVRGMGIGRTLVMTAVSRAYSRGFESIQVATQAANLPALRLYEAAGFSVRTTTFVYHYWNA